MSLPRSRRPWGFGLPGQNLLRLSSLLGCTVVLSLLVACGGGGAAPSSSSAPSSGAPAASPAANAPAPAASPAAASAPAAASPAAVAASPASAPAAAAPTQAGGQVVVGMQYDTGNLDPATLNSVTDTQEAGSIYDGLIRYKLGTTEVEPALATSWEAAPDGKKLTFKLRSGVTFHDGTPFKASDVKFTFERIVDPATKSNAASFYKNITTIETPDDQTVVLTLGTIDPAIMDTLASASGFILPEKYVKEKGAAFAQAPIGTGAFKFDHWTPGNETVVVRNPSWWGGAPKLERIIYKPISDPSTMYAAFEAGNVDIIQVTDPDKYEKYQKESAKYTVVEKTGLITRFFGMNTHAQPFDKLEVRQAVLHAVNRPAMVEGLFKGMSTVATQAAAPGVDAHVDGLEQLPYNPERAKQLLAQAGLPNGFTFEFFVPNIDRFTKPATVIQEDLKAVGINAEIKVMEAQSLLAAIAKGEAPMYILSRGQEPSGDRLLYTWFSSKSFPPGNNWAYIDNPDIDKWLDDFRGTTDAAKRKEAAKQIQQAVNAGAYYDFLDHEKHIYAVQKKVQGYVVDPQRSLKLWPVSVAQ